VVFQVIFLMLATASVAASHRANRFLRSSAEVRRSSDLSMPSASTMRPSQVLRGLGGGLPLLSPVPAVSTDKAGEAEQEEWFKSETLRD